MKHSIIQPQAQTKEKGERNVFLQICIEKPTNQSTLRWFTPKKSQIENYRKDVMMDTTSPI